MKEKILDIFKNHPRHYVQFIKKDNELVQWIEQNNHVVDGNFKEKIYSAISGESNICSNSRKRHVTRLSEGFVNCGPAASCACTKNAIAQRIKETKQKINAKEKEKTNQKRRSTMLAKYGVEYNSQRNEIKHIWTKPKISNEVYEKLNNYQWLDQAYNIEKRTLMDIADELGVYYSTVGEYCRKYNFEIRQNTNYSLEEKTLAEYVESLGFVCIRNDWNTLGKEIDVLIPSKKLGIEVNGLYWHSFHPASNKEENKFRHIEKTLAAKQVCIELLHFTDYDISHKLEIVKSIIKSKLGLNARIFARSCKIQEVSKKVEREFTNQYHIQGYVPSIKCLGLYHNGELVSLMSIGKTRYSRTANFELLRFCTKSNLTVVGGGSKLIKRLGKEFDSIVSYCDRSRSQGLGYKMMGFKEIGITGPGYFWTNGNLILSRYRCQKSQLKKWLTSFDASKSESQNMFDAGYRRYHDCGHKIFLYTSKN